MKLVQIAGYLGSGKTSLIIPLVKGLAEDGKKVAVLVNDVGEVPIDGKIMKAYGLTVKDIGGGCICCQVAGSMRRTLDVLAKNQNPDIVVIEPTGMAVPEAVRQTALLDAARTGITIGPTIVLFDTTRAQKLLGYETLVRLVVAQLRDADVIALSKVDLSGDDEVKRAGEAVHHINPKAEILRLSVLTGQGVRTISRAVQEITVNV